MSLLLVSARRRWRRQCGWLIAYRSSFFLSFFIKELISAVTYPSAEFFLPTHVSWLGVVNVLLEFRLSFKIISQGSKNAKKSICSRVFHWVTSRFRSLRKNGLGYSKTVNGLIIYDDLSFIWYITDYCGGSSSPDHRVQTLIKFRKAAFSSNGDVIWLRIILLLTTMTSPSTNLISLPFSHPTCDRHDIKIIVQGDEPEKLSVKFWFWSQRGNFGVK